MLPTDIHAGTRNQTRRLEKERSTAVRLDSLGTSTLPVPYCTGTGTERRHILIPPFFTI